MTLFMTQIKIKPLKTSKLLLFEEFEPVCKDRKTTVYEIIYLDVVNLCTLGTIISKESSIRVLVYSTEIVNIGQMSLKL